MKKEKGPEEQPRGNISQEIQRVVDQVIQGRRSVRAFLPTPVPNQTILEILDVAARAPSGTNTQPWQTIVVTGEKKDSLSKELVNTALDPVRDAEHTQEYSYYPDKWVPPYIDRRRKVGYDLYGLPVSYTHLTLPTIYSV